MKVNIVTLGCSKNVVDSENVAGHLKKNGIQVWFDSNRTDWDVCIVNTCGFIGDAKAESVNTLLELSEIKQRGRKPRKLIAIGCLIERYKKELEAEIPEIDAFYGVHEWKSLIRSLVDEYSGQLASERLRSTPRHYAYLKIAEGCNRSCSYCAIPLIRGKHVSRPIDELVEEAKSMVQNGVQEIIVIAQDTTYYGMDLYGRRRLGELLERLATETGAPWIRLHYTYPTSFPTDAIEVMRRHKNICNYIDIPLQHINSNLLKSMQRGIDREGTLELLRQFRQSIPDVAIRTTLIVGYPGEGEDEFEELKQFVSNAQFDRMGVFAYSPEEGTPAYSLGDPIDEETKQRRIDELMAIQEKISLAKNEALVGRTLPVLIDRREGDYYIGRTEYDSPEVDDEVVVSSTKPLIIGRFYNITITEGLENDLMGAVAD